MGWLVSSFMFFLSSIVVRLVAGLRWAVACRSVEWCPLVLNIVSNVPDAPK